MSDASERIYKDIDGNPCTLLQLVRQEPEWAVSRIRELDKQKQDATKAIKVVHEKYKEAIVLGKEYRTGDKRVFIMSGHEVDKIEALYDLWQAIKADGVKVGWIEEKK